MTQPQPQFHRMRSDWVQWLTPAPKRFLQRLILKHNLKTGLDIGCGIVSPLTALRAHGFHSTGMDISDAEIQRSRAANVHDELICGDFRTMDLGRTFDVVILSHLIEHFTREDAMEVIRRVEQLATRLIYIETPNGFIEQTAFDNNPFQRHLSGWFPHDFEARGYTVVGAGCKRWRGSATKPPPFPAPVQRFLDLSTRRYVFRRPHLSAAISAIRYTDAQGNLREV